MIAEISVLGIPVTTDWVAAMQRDDPEILEVRNRLEADDRETHERFTMCDARVYKVTKGKWRLYVPSDLRYEIVSEAHRGLTHLGIDKTLEKMKESYHFPRLREFVTQFVNRYINCLYYKGLMGKKPGLFHPLNKGNAPFQSIHMDHLVPLITAETGEKYVVAAVCGYSKYTMLRAVTKYA